MLIRSSPSLRSLVRLQRACWLPCLSPAVQLTMASKWDYLLKMAIRVQCECRGMRPSLLTTRSNEFHGSWLPNSHICVIGKRAVGQKDALQHIHRTFFSSFIGDTGIKCIIFLQNLSIWLSKHVFGSRNKFWWWRQPCDVSMCMWFLERNCWRDQVLWGMTPYTLVYSWRNARGFCCVLLKSAMFRRYHQIYESYVPLDSKLLWHCRSEGE